MNLPQCPNGHFYEPAKHTTCPYCGVQGLDLKTTPFRVPVSESRGNGAVARTHPRAGGWPAEGSDPLTETLIVSEQGIDPVVGWLVCVDGPDRGRDYRIRTENNPIGRSAQMYIRIDGDDSVARDRHATVAFEPRHATFHLAPGDARGLVYLNGSPVLAAVRLRPFDEIVLGRTTLRFVPLCGEQFQWKKLEERAV